MKCLLAACLLAVLAAGCGNEDKKPADPTPAKPHPVFDKQLPRGAKKGPSIS